MIRVIDVFSGIGGFSLGLESTGGFQTVAFCEIEAFPREVLAVHWPEVPCFTDVRELKLSLGDADMIVGGFPCQDISVAGKGAGIDGERSGLWRELFRLVRECRPRWVLVENVSALRTRGADRVLADLEAEGYSCWPLVVGAWAVGAPHKRDRVWIVAHKQGSGQLRTPELEDRSQSQEPERHGTSLRWPARPGEPQHEWEEPRLVAHAAKPRQPAGERDAGAGRETVGSSDGSGSGDDDARSPQQPMGCPTDELRSRLARCVVVTDGTTSEAGPHEVLRVLQRCADPEAVRQAIGGPLGISETTLLRLALHGSRQGNGRARSRNPAEPNASGDPAEGQVRTLPQYAAPPTASHQPRQDGQPARERRDAMRVVPRQRSLEEREAQILLDYLMNERLARRANREALKALGNSVVPRVVAAIGRAILRVERG